MSSSMNDVMQLCRELSENLEVKMAVKSSVSAGAVTGMACCAGGLVAGPPGIAVGGAVGGLWGWWMTSGQFKPLPQIIMALPQQQKEKLHSSVMAVLGSLKWDNLIQLLEFVKSNDILYQKVIEVVLDFFKNDQKAEVKRVI
ncbi:protein C19orf12 homolog [Denticeps clupeoides]|uniref:CS012 protein n=1 Tax=Denticeps clupeoides TaxID=299321 RepID=A0AAY4EQ05_9TELE|nr:protein C19orf12 homolog [Denticeps clupeoides]